MNIKCRYLLPLVDPKVRSTKVGLLVTPVVTLRILNTTMPIIRVCTAMDAAKLVINNVILLDGL